MTLAVQQKYAPQQAETQLINKAAQKTANPNIDLDIQNKPVDLGIAQRDLKTAEIPKMTPQGPVQQPIQQMVKPAELPPVEQVPGQNALAYGPGTQMQYAPEAPFNPMEVNPQGLANLEKTVAEHGGAGPELAQMGKDIRGQIRGTPEQPGLLGEERGQQYQDLMARHNEMRLAQDQMGKSFGNLKPVDVQDLSDITQKLRGLAGQGETGMADKNTLEKAFFDTLKKGTDDPAELAKIDNLQQNMTDEAWRRVLSAKGESKNILFMLGHFLIGSGTRIGEAVGLGVNKLSQLKTVAKPINDLMNLGGKVINQTADGLEAKGKTTQAQFLRNFSSADVNKKKAMLFSASQNPDLRDTLKSEFSENKE